MNCYIIPVGGTGERVMRSIVHIMASGALSNLQDLKEVHFMGVDSDGTNGDKIRMEQTIQKYMNVRHAGIVRKDLIRPFSNSIDFNRFIWSPLNQAASMASIEGYSMMDDNTKDLYDFLYTEEEKNIVLKGGFYSHTSIGSYYMTNGIAELDENTGRYSYVGDWANFFANVTPEDKIVIICSMFGGTGASGVPTLARRIHEVERTSQCQIAGIFVEPYFRTVKEDGEKDIIDWSAFSIKSKIAFEYYYNQKFDKKIFNKMYFIGEDPDKLMPVKHSIHGSTQLNKANPVELYAATAVVDFIASPQNQAAKVAWRGEPDRDFVLGKDLLNSVSGVPVLDKIGMFFQFSVLYTKFLYHCIKAKDVKQCKWLRNYNFFNDTGDISENVEELYVYCRMYIQWLREIITAASPDGAFNGPATLSANVSNNNEYINWFARGRDELFDGTAISEGIYLEKCQYIDRTLDSERAGYPDLIKGKKSVTAEYIYTELCNQKVSRTRNLQEFVVDIMCLSTTGRFPERN